MKYYARSSRQSAENTKLTGLNVIRWPQKRQTYATQLEFCQTDGVQKTFSKSRVIFYSTSVGLWGFKRNDTNLEEVYVFERQVLANVHIKKVSTV